MTITDILNFANKYNLSDEARDELIKMIVLDQTNSNKIKFNTTPYNPKLGPSDNIIQKNLKLLLQGKTPSIKTQSEGVVVASYGCSNDRLAGTLCLKDRNIIDEKIDLMRKGYYSNKTKNKTGLRPVIWRD